MLGVPEISRLFDDIRKAQVSHTAGADRVAVEAFIG